MTKESTPMVVALRAARSEAGRVIAVKAELSNGNVVTYMPDEQVPMVGTSLRETYAPVADELPFDLDDARAAVADFGRVTS